MSPSGIGLRTNKNTYKNNLQLQVQLHPMLQHSPSQQFALVIKQLLLQVNLTISNKFVAAVFEKHLHYVDQYADMLEAKMERMEFANKIRIQLFVVKTIKGFGKKQYKEMEAALIDAIIQLQQLATPPPTTTTMTELPLFLTNNEWIHGILHSFVNKTLNKQAQEREEKPTKLGLTQQQEMIYATE
jgi:hypothetical protein